MSKALIKGYRVNLGRLVQLINEIAPVGLRISLEVDSCIILRESTQLPMEETFSRSMAGRYGQSSYPIHRNPLHPFA